MISMEIASCVDLHRDNVRANAAAIRSVNLREAVFCRDAKVEATLFSKDNKGRKTRQSQQVSFRNYVLLRSSRRRHLLLS